METVVEPVQEGNTAPDFKLDSNHGPVSLETYRGRQNILLYFMREFNCLACRQHVVQLGRMYSELQAKGVDVLVVGGGSREEAERLAATYKLPFAVAGDIDREVYHSYGLHKALGMIQRSGSILVDKTGRVRYIERTTLPTGGLDKKELMSAIEQL